MIVPSTIDMCRAPRPAASSLLVALLLISCDSTGPRRAVALAIATELQSIAWVGLPLHPFVVEVRDQKGRGLAQSGIAVTVTISDGGGTLVGTTTQFTDGDGRVTFVDLAIRGTVGPRTLRFSAGGLTAVTSPIELLAGPPRKMEALSPRTLQGTVGTAVTPLPSVILKDESDNPVDRVVVRFTTRGVAAGALTGSTPTTGTDGVATLGGWVLPTTAGQYTLYAEGLGRSGTIAFLLTFVATAIP